MNTAMMPAGWYRDPAARHEQRWWDGWTWTSHVVDGGYAAEDPAPGIAPTYAAGAVAVGPGYRAVSVSLWQRTMVAIAGMVLILFLVFEILATFFTLGITSIVGEDFLWLWSWLYKPVEITFGSRFITHEVAAGFMPIAAWIVLIAAIACASAINLRPDVALKKAGARGAGFRSSDQERRVWETTQLNLASLHIRLFRSSYRVLVVLTGIASVALILLGALAIFGQTATTTTGRSVSDLSVGLGPWLAVSAGAIAAAAMVLTWPWRGRPSVVIHADGSLEREPRV